MFSKQIPSVAGQWLELRTDDQSLIDHIQDPANHVEDIINQFSQEYRDLFGQRRYQTVLDIGANIGLFSLYLGAACDRIYAVEPTPGHFDLLTKITASNHNITPVNVALSDRDGPVEFFISKENSTMNTLTQTLNDVYDQRISVQGLRIQSLLDHLSIEKTDLIKLDIEGGESVCITDQLVGAVSHRVDAWFVECHGNSVGGSWQQMLHSTSAVLDRAGYRVYHVTHDGIMAQKPTLPAPKASNPSKISGQITIPI